MNTFLVPPKHVRLHTATLQLPRGVTVQADAACSAATHHLQELLGAYSKTCRLSIAPALIIISQKVTGHGPESYTLEVTPRGITIVADDAAGAFYAVQTLRELLASHGDVLPCCTIRDWPDFRRRGVYLDVSRGRVPTLACLKDLATLLAQWKVNELQLNIENVFQFTAHPDIGKGYSPLSAKDIVALREHCARHHMQLVGAFASFGHFEKILQLPNYRMLGELPSHHEWPGGTTICPTDPRSIRFIAELYAEFVPLFTAADFNINGDEPWELGEGRSKRKADKVGKGRVYLDFVLQLDKLLRKHGKRTNMWTDIVLQHPELLDDVPRDMVMCNWDYDPAGERLRRTGEIAAHGFPVVVCPGTSSWNTHGGRMQLGMDNIRSFAAEGLRHRAEGLLNTDWGDNGHRNLLAVSLHNLAWGAAQSWHHTGTNADDFTARFSRAVFGIQDARFADALRTLGGCAHACLLYGILMKPIQWNWDALGGALHGLKEVNPETLRAHAAALRTMRWPALPAAATPFARRLREELVMATALDALACRRALAFKHAQLGAQVAPREWQGLGAQTEAVMHAFARVWRLHNRPSRLREHLAGFRATLRTYQQNQLK